MSKLTRIIPNFSGKIAVVAFRNEEWETRRAVGSPWQVDDLEISIRLKNEIGRGCHAVVYESVLLRVSYAVKVHTSLTTAGREMLLPLPVVKASNIALLHPLATGTITCDRTKRVFPVTLFHKADFTLDELRKPEFEENRLQLSLTAFSRTLDVFEVLRQNFVSHLDYQVGNILFKRVLAASRPAPFVSDLGNLSPLSPETESRDRMDIATTFLRAAASLSEGEAHAVLKGQREPPSCITEEEMRHFRDLVAGASIPSLQLTLRKVLDARGATPAPYLPSKNDFWDSMFNYLSSTSSVALDGLQVSFDDALPTPSSTSVAESPNYNRLAHETESRERAPSTNSSAVVSETAQGLRQAASSLAPSDVITNHSQLTSYAADLDGGEIDEDEGHHGSLEDIHAPQLTTSANKNQSSAGENADQEDPEAHRNDGVAEIGIDERGGIPPDGADVNVKASEPDEQPPRNESESSQQSDNDSSGAEEGPIIIPFDLAHERNLLQLLSDEERHGNADKYWDAKLASLDDDRLRYLKRALDHVSAVLLADDENPANRLVQPGRLYKLAETNCDDIVVRFLKRSLPQLKKQRKVSFRHTFCLRILLELVMEEILDREIHFWAGKSVGRDEGGKYSLTWLCPILRWGDSAKWHALPTHFLTVLMRKVTELTS